MNLTRTQQLVSHRTWAAFDHCNSVLPCIFARGGGASRTDPIILQSLPSGLASFHDVSLIAVSRVPPVGAHLPPSNPAGKHQPQSSVGPQRPSLEGNQDRENKSTARPLLGFACPHDPLEIVHAQNAFVRTLRGEPRSTFFFPFLFSAAVPLFQHASEFHPFRHDGNIQNALVSLQRSGDTSDLSLPRISSGRKNAKL